MKGKLSYCLYEYYPNKNYGNLKINIYKDNIEILFDYSNLNCCISKKMY